MSSSDNIVKQDKRGIKRDRDNIPMISDDIAMKIGSFLEHTDISEIEAMNIPQPNLVDEIRKHKPSFTLASYLMKQRMKRESLGYIIYNIIKDWKWTIEVMCDSYTTNGVRSKTIKQLYMEIVVSDIDDIKLACLSSGLYLNDKYISSKYPIQIFNTNGGKDYFIKVDLTNYTIPNEIIYLREKNKISNIFFTDENTALVVNIPRGQRRFKKRRVSD